MYTPGSLSRMLKSSSWTDSGNEQTHLQVLFSKPAEPFLNKPAKLVSSVDKYSSHLSLEPFARPCTDIVKGTTAKKRRKDLEGDEIDPVFKREESLRNAEVKTSRKTRKKLERVEKVQSKIAVEQLASSPQEADSEPCKTVKEINAENAAKRLATKSVDMKQKRDRSQDDRTVFVGNVPLSVTKKALLRLFKTCGKVKTVRLRSAPVADLKLPKKASIIKKEFHPSRHTANFYIVFISPADAEKALSLNGHELEGFHIRVDLASVNKHDHQKSVFVGNIPFDTEEENLRKHFSECGEISNVRIIRDKTTGVGKGFGYVAFADSSSVSLALSMNNQSYNGRPLRVQRSTSSPASKLKTKSRKDVTDRSTKLAGNQNSGSRLKERHRKRNSTGTEQQSAKERPKKVDGKVAVDHKKHKELRKKKMRKRAVEKKKESIGNFLTKPKKIV